MEKIIYNLSEFIYYIQECKNKNYPDISEGGKHDKIVYRGHANKEWECFPKLFRERIWFDNETEIINQILRKCPYEFEGLNGFETLVKMQHYGAPTRLLDFTGNPLIALYFACDDKTQEKEDGVVLLCNNPVFYENEIPIEPFLYKLFPNRTNYIIGDNRQEIDKIMQTSNVMVIAADLKNQRIKNQDGYFAFFTYTGEYGKVFNPIEENDCIQEKIIIPKECKLNILSELNDYGFNRAFVYPELENQIKEICKNIKV